MSVDTYRVLAAGHIDNGKALAIGETVLLRADQAARHPELFQRVTPAKAERPARNSRSAPPSTPLASARSTHQPVNED